MKDIDLCTCSFCGKSQKNVKKLIASPNGDAYIALEFVLTSFKKKWKR